MPIGVKKQMLYALISDIHANKVALDAVLKDIKDYNVNEIICLGDIVGYGPNPKEVIDTLQREVDNFVLGNHDAVIASKFSKNHFVDEAKVVINWTIQELGIFGFEFFDNMPFILEGDGFICAHAEFKNPDNFGYITTPEKAVENFNHVKEKLLFVGHTHFPGVYITGKSGKVHWISLNDIGDGFNIEKDKRYIINVGSVGAPRDENLKASYVLYDSTKQKIFFRQISFSYEELLKDYKKANLPEKSNSSLESYFKQNKKKKCQYDYLRDLIKS